MGARRTRAALAACLALGLLLAAGPAEAAKKKAKKPGPFAQTQTVNAAIPEGPAAGGRATPLVSTITVPKKYKGSVVGDVDVTGIETAGSAAGAAAHLAASLSAPNGRTIDLFSSVGGAGLQSIGPWTIDDDTSVGICNASPATPCGDSTRTLHPPFAGTSNTIFNFIGSFPTNGPLASFEGVPMDGTWTLRVFDVTNVGALTSSLGRWGLAIAPAKPPPAAKTKNEKKAKPFSRAVTVNAAIPNGVAGTRSVPLTSTITVPKRYKGKLVGDLNVTGLQTTGDAAGAATQLTAYLIAPGGRTFQLFLGVGDQSLGPWTIDDDTPVGICNAILPAQCPNPEQSLGWPFSGTSNSNYNFAGFPVNGRLTIFNGTAMRGAWTLLLTDSAPGPSSALNTWGLKITPAKPGG